MPDFTYKEARDQRLRALFDAASLGDDHSYNEARAQRVIEAGLGRAFINALAPGAAGDIVAAAEQLQAAFGGRSLEPFLAAIGAAILPAAESMVQSLQQLLADLPGEAAPTVVPPPPWRSQRPTATKAPMLMRSPSSNRPTLRHQARDAC